MEQKRNRKPHIFHHNGFWRVSRAVKPWEADWEKTTNMNLHVRAHFFVGMLNDKEVRFKFFRKDK